MKNIVTILVLVCSFVSANDPKSELKNSQNDKYLQKYFYQNSNQSVVCESLQGRRTRCNVDTRFGVNFVRQLSNTNCTYHWGYDQTGIWVDGGCRAEFRINNGWSQPGFENNIMVCESHNYQRNYCSALLGGRDVFMLRQISNASCINNWGYDRNGIWVTNGCRGEFVIEDRFGSQNDIVVCSSRNLRYQLCATNTRGGVEFLRQLSRSSCNGNWGYNQQGIWVTNGCRAKFRLQQLNYGNGYYQNDIISCSSRNLQRKICPADTSGGVRLKKQKSRSSCRGNWGYTNNNIWVDNGCRALFQLYINSNNRGNLDHSGDRFPNQNPPINNRILCESLNSRRKTCAIPFGSKVKLNRQISRSSCKGNWGYNQRELWVNNGCRGEFSVF